MVRYTFRYSVLFSLAFLGSFLAAQNVKAAVQPVAVVIYDGANYTGNALQIRYNMPSLKDMNRRMTSYRLRPGFTVRFYEGANYTGGFYTRKSNDFDSSRVQFNNKIQSVEILADGIPEYQKPPVAATIFDREGYSGKSLQIRYNTPSLGSMSRKLSSFQVSPGYQVRFFTRDNYQGEYYTRDDDDTDGAYMSNWSHQIRSVKILKTPKQSAYVRNGGYGDY